MKHATIFAAAFAAPVNRIAEQSIGRFLEFLLLPKGWPHEKP
jgi:hypothetical protein